MDEFITTIDPNKYIRTYSKLSKSGGKKSDLNSTNEKVQETTEDTTPEINNEEKPLTTKEAVKLLVEESLGAKVCRFCLNICTVLTELDQLMTIGSNIGLYSISISDMVASFYPYKLHKESNFPNKVCNNCVDRIISSYLFTQQCDQTERAVKNCFEDIYDKLNKLDPLERVSKRGRQKTKLNHNKLYVEHKNVIDYAEPTMHIVGTTDHDPNMEKLHDFECLKCAQVLPNLELLVNHVKSHPKTMWYNCRLCGKSFPKLYQLRKHLKEIDAHKTIKKTEASIDFNCEKCGAVSDNYHEFLQHTEKEKFKTVIEHIVESKMDKLCTVCFDKGRNMLNINDVACFHGGLPELTGEKTIRNILDSTIPQISHNNLTGTNVCEKCYNNVLSTYLFTKHVHYVRNRLLACVTSMLDNLSVINNPSNNLCIEIPQDSIMPRINQDNETLVEEDRLDTSKMHIDVLEDEFRLDSEGSLSEDDIKVNIVESSTNYIDLDIKKDVKIVKTEQGPINGVREQISKTKHTNKLVIYTCPICVKHFVSDYFLKTHILKHVRRKVECAVCNLNFKSKFHLYEHNKLVHVLNKFEYVSCKICSRCFLNMDKLKRHEKQHTKKSCPLCNKQFKNLIYLEIHMQKHVKVLKILNQKYLKTCSFCEKQCVNNNALSLHVNKVHFQIKPYNCDMCEKQFYTEYNLRYHKKVHQYNYSREKCNFCNKIFNCRRSLVVHIKKHIGLTPYPCILCKLSFTTRSKMKQHISTHFV